MIKETGEVKIIHKYETAITNHFKELSFYFVCSEVFGSNSDSKIFASCYGSEGPEDTFGLIEINFDKSEAKHVIYCINPLEKNVSRSVLQNDNVYSCYDENKNLYFKGPIDTDYSF